MATTAEIIQKCDTLKTKIEQIPDSAFKAPKYIQLQKDKLKNRVDNVKRLVNQATPNSWNSAIFILTWRIRRCLDYTKRFAWVKDPLPAILDLIDEIIADIESLFINTPPVALLEINGMDPGQYYTAPKGMELTFSGSSSWDEDGHIAQWRWDFSDGTPVQSGETVKHTFTTAGTYRVTLTVEDNGSPPEEATDWVDVSVI